MATMFSMYAAKCPHCAARLAVSRDAEETVCEYCGTTVLLRRKSRPEPGRPQVAPRPNAGQNVAQVRASKAIISVVAASAIIPVGIAAFALTRHASTSTSMPSHASGAGGAGSAAEEAAVDPDVLLAEKVDTIVGCVTDSALLSRDRYLTWVDPESGPTGRERHKYGLYEVNYSEGCDEQLRGVGDREPALPDLDAAALAYADALKSLAPITSEANEYYAAEDYKDDDFARGKEMHSALMQGFTDLEDSLETLLAEVTPIADALVAREVAAAEGARDMPLYWGRKAFMTARDLVAVTSAVDKTGIPSLDQERFSSLLDQLIEETGKLKESDGESRLESVYSSFGGLLKHAKGLRRMAARGKNFRSSALKGFGTSSGWMTDYSPDRIRYEYSSVLRSQRELFGGERVVEFHTAAGAALQPSDAAAGETLQAEANAPPAESSPTPEATRANRAGAPAAEPPPPTGPVLSVAEATPILSAKVIDCMRQNQVHSLQARMGNSKVGPVKVLGKPHTSRVDGLRTRLVGSKLGRCMDEAGNTLRARAFKSNYILLNLKNDAAPNPLAGLPGRHDRKKVEATIDAVEGKIRECAAKHGEEGAQGVFYFTVDGPTGEVISARSAYGSAPFKKCAEKIYRGLSFEKVQENEYKHTANFRL